METSSNETRCLGTKYLLGLSFHILINHDITAAVIKNLSFICIAIDLMITHCIQSVSQVL